MARLMRWLRRIGVGAIGLALIGWVAFAGLTYAGQRSLLFRPDPTDIAGLAQDLAHGEAVRLMAEDGVALNAWWVPPQRADAPVYLYLHGNAGNLRLRLGRFAELTRTGAGLLAVSWRGYGGSEGEPSEEGFHRDAAAAHAFVVARIPAQRIVAFGESLGTAPAIRLAATRDVGALVLDSAYSAIADIGQRRFPLLPVRLLIRDPFDAAADAPQVRVPVLAAHCRQDWITPLDLAEALMAAFPTPPRLVVVDRRCHLPRLSEAIGPALPALLGALGLRP
jgi:hypothetical protein